jgi:cell division protein FtsQ
MRLGFLNPFKAKKKNHLSKERGVQSSASKRQRPQRAMRSKWRRPEYRLAVGVGSCVVFLCFAWLAFFLDYPQKTLTWGQNKLIIFTSHLGFRLDEVLLEGRHNSPQDAVLKAIQAQRGDPILAYSLETIRENLEKLDWIKSAVVQRRLPNVLYIRITERQPIALWQHQKQLFFVDTEGVVINSPILSHFQKLPVVVGSDAPAHTPKILSILEKFPEISKKITALNRIRQRRWDITLEESVQVKLPEDHLEEALTRLTLLIQQQKISPSETLVVDLRLPKQVIMRLTPTANVRLKVKGKET